MSHLSKAFLLILLHCIFSQGLCMAQSNWDGVLDRYELICSKCIDLKQKISNGESVPAKSVTSLLQELSALRSSLSEASISMTASQRKRFERIKASYASSLGGSRPTASNKSVLVSKPKTAAMPHSAATQPLAKNSNEILSESADSGRTSVLCERLDSLIQAPLLTTESSISIRPAYAPSVDASKAEWTVGCLGAVEASMHPTYGMMLYAKKSKLGVYALALSSFTQAKTDYACNSNGAISGGGSFWGSGNSCFCSYKFLFGPMASLPLGFSILAGAGYDSTTISWEDLSGNWARVEDLSACGIVLNAGILKTFGHFSLCVSEVYMPNLIGFSTVVAAGVSF